jgi:PAS domain S-box-containing protein
VRFLGKGRWPEPIRNSFDAMMSPQNAGRWSEVEGVVSGYNDGRLTLLAEGKELTVWVNQITLGNESRVPGSRLRIRGVCDPIVNTRDQMLGLRLLVPASDCIEVINAGPSDPFSLPEVAIASVLLSGPAVAGGPAQVVRTEGIVTYKSRQMLCLQDTNSGMRVFLQRESTDILPGDRIQVAGLALPDGFSPKLVQALARKIGRGDLPAPGVIDFMQNWVQSGQDVTRGQVDAIFQRQGTRDSAPRLELRCEATQRDFCAYLPAAAPLPPSMLPGARVRLRGVIKLQVEEPLDANQVVTAFEMYLNSPADIQVLAFPSWWTARHTWWVVGGLGLVLIVSLGWTNALRGEVRRQTRALKQENAERKQAQAELAGVNATLRKENLERKQAEEALRSQEERTRSIIDQAFDAVITTDIDFRVVGWNRAAETMLGWPRAEALGCNLLDTVVPPSRRENRRRELERFRATGEWRDLNRLIQSTAVQRDGRELPVELTITPIRLGDQCTFTLFLRDITSRKAAEAALAQERHLLESLLAHSPDAIYFKDRQSRFLRWSKSMCQRFGGGAADLIGKTDFDLFTEDHARPAFEDEQEIIRSGRPLIGKIEREVAMDGRESWALTCKMPLRNEAGEIVGTFGISKDITALKQAEADLAHTHKELVLASRLAGMAEVATDVLHNVGNVLNSINVSASLVDERVRNSRVVDVCRLAELLERHTEDRAAFLTRDPKGQKVPGFIICLAQELASEQAAILEEISSLRRNVEHVNEIVAMQQSYAQISGAFENINVTDLLEDSLRMNADSLARHHVKIVRDFSVLPPICTDRHKVLQILINLLRNAEYACDKSGRSDKQVILRASNGDGRVEVAIIDNGVGIPPENLTRIFNHGFTTRKDGHGFGLHSGALAAKELGGSLTAHSQGWGLGAVFTLQLPCRPPAGRQTEPSQDRPHEAVATP